MARILLGAGEAMLATVVRGELGQLLTDVLSRLLQDYVDYVDEVARCVVQQLVFL